MRTPSTGLVSAEMRIKITESIAKADVEIAKMDETIADLIKQRAKFVTARNKLKKFLR